MASSDTPQAVAFNEAAPTSERFDAQVDLAKAHRPPSFHILPPEELRETIAFIQDGLEAEALMKAQANVVRFPAREKNPPKRGMQSVVLDQQQIFASGEYYEKPSALDFGSLRQMCYQTPMLAAIIQTRIRQVSRFCNPSEDGGPGFEIRHLERDHKMTPAEQEEAKLLGKFIANCGWEFNPRRRRAMRRQSFAGFMARSIRDSLSMDSSPIETEMKRDSAKGIDGFYAVDGATIRLCTDEGYEGDDAIFALQVVEGRIMASYTLDQLIYEVRNPRTDVNLAGYGLAEPELLIRIVTGFLNALTYNSRGFDHNAIPRGLLHLSGTYGKEDLIAFKRYWNSMVKGINNAWSMPILVSEDQESKASFENFGVEFNEMAFAKWMTFLGAIACSIYGMDPAEINFESFAAQKSTLSGDDTSEKLEASQDKGLKPFMGFYEGVISDFIVSSFTDRMCFRWVGLEQEDKAREWEADKLSLTVNELRAIRGKDAYPTMDGLDLGTAPINPSLFPAWMAAVQPGGGQDFGGQAPEDQGDYGTPDDEPGAGAPDTGDGTPGARTGPNDRGQPPPGEGGGNDFGKSFIYTIGD